MTPAGPKIAETFIHPSVKLREAQIGARCEILERSSVAYSTLGDASYLGHDCQVADADIGKFCAIAACVRIGPPNHPMGRPAQAAGPQYRPSIPASSTEQHVPRAVGPDLALRQASNQWAQGHALFFFREILVG